MTRHRPETPAIYARISVDRSGEALGVERQIDECKAKAAALGWPVPVVYVDNDISASSGKRRPAFERLLADLASGKRDGLVAWHLDRVLRRVLDLERLLDAVEANPIPTLPVEFLRAGAIDLSSASGRMLARILASVAAAESELKSERLQAQKKQEAEKGRPPSVLGYGWNTDNQIVPDQAAIIREVAERLLGGETVNRVATDLNARGVPTPRGPRWDARRVRYLLDRGERPDVVTLIDALSGLDAVVPAEAVALLNAAGGAQADGSPWTVTALAAQPWSTWFHQDFEAPQAEVAAVLRDAGVAPDPTAWRSSALIAMITRASLAGLREFSPGPKGGLREVVAVGDWPAILSRETVDELRAMFKPGTRKPQTETKYLLSNVLRCSQCGNGLTGGPARAGHRYGCIHGPGRDRCGKVSVAGRQVDHMVSTLMIDVLADADVRSGAKRVGPGADKIAEAEAELKAIAALREEYAAEAAQGGITLAEWKTFRAGLDARQKAAEKVVGSWSPSKRNVLTGVPAAREEIERWWEAATVLRRRQVIMAFIDRIEVGPNTRPKGSTAFDPSRVGDPVWLV